MTGPREIRDGLRRNPAFLVAQTARIMRDRVSQALRGTGVSVQELTILRLLQASGPLNQHELGTACNLDKTTITELIDSLQNSKLVRREVNANDRRAKHVIITASGKRVLTKASRLAESVETEFLDMLSDREWSTVQKCLQRFLEQSEKS
jgi:DNA-binding MarR family transcriptional regulator